MNAITSASALSQRTGRAVFWGGWRRGLRVAVIGFPPGRSQAARRYGWAPQGGAPHAGVSSEKGRNEKRGVAW
ncbi:hypothetical protein GCM10017600_88830 [Streptosporangium carneum]|uniref:Uncharacterized protein n=1 Tax=Streptosporangium carneum TaxID=47481 RepID=A0A9W6IDF2_9ACTN|nr:hypothetical protein GCM10017600_88830 [Streptosporangium carneum]